MTNIEADGGGAETEVQRKKFSGKKIALFVGAPLLILGLIGGGLAYTGVLGKLLGKEEKKKEEVVEEKPAEEAFDPKAPPVYVPLGDMLVNLQSLDRRPSYLKLKVQLELYNQKDAPEIPKAMPRIVDTFQTYLRELRLEDLKGSAGIYRLREELLQRVNAATAPVRVRDVLFEEVLVQAQ